VECWENKVTEHITDDYPETGWYDFLEFLFIMLAFFAFDISLCFCRAFIRADLEYKEVQDLGIPRHASHMLGNQPA